MTATVRVKRGLKVIETLTVMPVRMVDNGYMVN